MRKLIALLVSVLLISLAAIPTADAKIKIKKPKINVPRAIAIVVVPAAAPVLLAPSIQITSRSAAADAINKTNDAVQGIQDRTERMVRNVIKPITKPFTDAKEAINKAKAVLSNIWDEIARALDNLKKLGPLVFYGTLTFFGLLMLTMLASIAKNLRLLFQRVQ